MRQVCYLHFYEYNRIQLLMLSNTFVGSGSGSGTNTKRKGRGKNNNTALVKLSPGQKIRLEFNDLGKVSCENDIIWSRHMGTVVRDPTVISHRLLNWEDLSSSDVEHF